MKHLPLITALSASALIISNIASTKLVALFGYSFDAGLLLFPLLYIIGDITTEVYGFRAARRIIWTGFVALLLAMGTLMVVDALPSSPEYPYGEAFSAVLGPTGRIVCASFVAYLVGEFLNSFIFARLKVRTRGAYFGVRAVVSSVFGQGADTVLFALIAFYGVYPAPVLLDIVLVNYAVKLAVEVVAVPLTLRIALYLKKSEGVDSYESPTVRSMVLG